jgi:predicted ester cyclase
MLEAAQGWKRAFPDGRGTVLAAYSDGPVAILEIQWEGTNTGPMEGPTGEEMPPSGKQARVKACQVFEVEDGRVKSTRHYFNLMTVMSQLGAGAPGAAAMA